MRQDARQLLTKIGHFTVLPATAACWWRRQVMKPAICTRTEHCWLTPLVWREPASLRDDGGNTGAPIGQPSPNSLPAEVWLRSARGENRCSGAPVHVPTGWDGSHRGDWSCVKAAILLGFCTSGPSGYLVRSCPDADPEPLDGIDAWRSGDSTVNRVLAPRLPGHPGTHCARPRPDAPRHGAAASRRRSAACPRCSCDSLSNPVRHDLHLEPSFKVIAPARLRRSKQTV